MTDAKMTKTFKTDGRMTSAIMGYSSDDGRTAGARTAHTRSSRWRTARRTGSREPSLGPGQRTSQALGVIAQGSQGGVAVHAQQAADNAGLMVVVDVELALPCLPAAETATAALLREELFVLGGCDPVVTPKRFSPVLVGQALRVVLPVLPHVRRAVHLGFHQGLGWGT